jgi:hypothetical protein
MLDVIRGCITHKDKLDNRQQEHDRQRAPVAQDVEELFVG